MEMIIQAMLLSHDMGCRRASILFNSNVRIEEVIEICKKATKVYENDVRETLKKDNKK